MIVEFLHREQRRGHALQPNGNTTHALSTRDGGLVFITAANPTVVPTIAATSVCPYELSPYGGGFGLGLKEVRLAGR